MNPVSISARTNQGFAIRGDTLYYAGIARVHFDELRQLLSRCSGQVVRGGKKEKIWFQAQCAHYGFPTENTPVELRQKLKESLESGKAYMEEKAGRVERDFRAAERKSRALSARPVERSPTPTTRPVTPVAPSPESAQPHEGAATAIAPQTPIRTRPRALHVVSSNVVQSPPPSHNFLPTPISRPRARGARRDPDSPTPNRAGATMRSRRNDSIVVPAPRATLPLCLLRPLYDLGPSQPRENPGQASRLERDVVSGRRELLVTHHTMEPPRVLSRVARRDRYPSFLWME